MTFPTYRALQVTTSARSAADKLAYLTEWAPAGLMLRVASLTVEGQPATAALECAQLAREECLNGAGRGVCAVVIRDLELLRDLQTRTPATTD